MKNCSACHQPADEHDPDTYHEITSWVNGPKLDGPKLREHTGRVMHKDCAEKLARGQAPDQPELFDEAGEPSEVEFVPPPFYDSLEEELRELELTNPEVGEAKKNLDAAVDRIVNPDDYVKPANLQIRRCDEAVKKGTGFGMCETVLDEHGACPNAGNHLEVPF